MNRAAPARWSGAVRVLHWGMAVLIGTLLALGFLMTRAGLDLPTTVGLYQAHKWLGLLALALLLPRLLARVGTSAPAAGAGPSARAARALHAGLYVLMLALPATGWLATSAAPLRLPLRAQVPLLGEIAVPMLGAPDARTFALASGLHQILAFALLGLLGLHVAGALKHALWDRDGTLRRMIV